MTAIAQRRVAGATAIMIMFYLLHAALLPPSARAADIVEFHIGECDEAGQRTVSFTVPENYQLTLVVMLETEVLVGKFYAGDHAEDLDPGRYNWYLYSPPSSGFEVEKGSFTVGECGTTSTTEPTTTTTTVPEVTTTTVPEVTTTTTVPEVTTTTVPEVTTTTVPEVTTTTVPEVTTTTVPEVTTTTVPEVTTTTVSQVTITVPEVTTTTIPFDELPDEFDAVPDEEPEVLGTTITPVPEVTADTLPFTGSETGGALKLALLALVAGGLMLFAARGPRDETSTVGVWTNV